MKDNNKSKKLEPAKCYDLDKIIDYSDASIVSRIIIRNSAGSITLFSFDEGQGLSEHTTPFDALVEVIEGEAELIIGGKMVIAKAGEMVLMPANVPHSVKAEKRFKMLLTMLKGE